MADNLKNKAITGIFYKGIEVVGVQGVQLVVSIVLARLLLPAEFGVIALITVFLQICACLIVVGFTSALIQKKNTSITEESTIFFLNIIVSIFLYCILFISAPYIASFFDEEILTACLRWTSVIIVINALSQVHLTLLTKEINFKPLVKVNVLALIISGIIGVYLANQGAGVWALVWQQISSSIVRTTMLWIVSAWRPSMIFELSCIRELFSFGSKLMLSGLIGTIFNNLYVLFIGKLYTPIDLAFYSRSKQLPWLIINTTSGIISSVMFPTFSKINNDRVRMKQVVSRVLKMTYFLIAPASVGLIVCASPLVELLLTKKWLPIVPYMQLISVMYLCLPLQGLNLEVLKALGCANVYLKLEIFKKSLLMLMLFITYKYGVLVMIFGQVLLAFITVFIDSYKSKELINYSTFEQLHDVFVSIVNALIMGGVCYSLIGFLPDNNFYKLIALTVIGTSVYTLLSFITKQQSLIELVDMAKKAIQSRLV